eukprot:scaffold33840_cov171-Skeletonema_menzelii.AAC.1
MATSKLLFTPPPSKSNAQKKSCICHWGDECSQLKTFFDKNKSELGQLIHVRYSDTCNFVNFYKAAVAFLHIPKKKQQQLKKQYEDFKAGRNNANCPRIRIAKFHFPYYLALQKNVQWTAPMLRKEVDESEIYINRDPPPQQDGLIIYNPELGEKQSKRAKEASNGEAQYRIVPCETIAEVKAIAAAEQNNNNNNNNNRALQPSTSVNQQTNSRSKAKKATKVSTERASVSITNRSSSANGVEQSGATPITNRPTSLVPNVAKHRHKRSLEQVAVRLEMEEKEAQDRTPDQWRKIITEEKSVMEERNAKLQARVESLMEQLRKKEEEVQQMKVHYEKQRKRVRRTKSSIEGEVVWEQCLELLSNVGGISRLTIFNDEWHANHVEAARLLWGYRSWAEAKLYVDVFFGEEVDVNYDPSANVRTSTTNGELILPDLTPFEQCMACRMFFHVFANEQIISLCLDRHRTRVGQILKEWAPKWAAVGMDLSCLDITADYIFKEVPDKNINLGMPRLVFVDGKDWLIAPKGNDSTIEKSTYSSKTEKTSARSLTFSSAAGLVFEWAPLVGGRFGERKIVEFMSELGIETAPIADWEDVAKNAEEDNDPIFWTALSDVMTAKEFDETIMRLEEGDGLVTNGLLDDGILITGQPTGLAREGLDENNADTDEEREDDDEEMSDADKMKSGRHIFGIDDALKCFDMMMKSKVVEKAQRDSGSDKRPPILTQEILQEQRKKALRNDPNRSGKRKLLQLERLQKLHLLYERGSLKKCLLSYYLLVTEDQRLKLLSWMGSGLASNITKPSLDELNELPLRLAKIPRDCGVGGDKGFSGIEYDLPNCNEVVTPPQIANSKKERLSKDQIESEVPITTTRAACETVFRRVDNEAVMKEKVPYWIIPWLPHGHALAHGEANLCRPLRYPGRNSIVGDDYWDNEKEYTRIPQPTQAAQAISTSSRRQCKRCKQGGIVEFCSTCSKWYHSDCHSFGSCDPSHAINPYT